MEIFQRKIKVSSEMVVSSEWAIPENYRVSERFGLIIAHGAGNDMNNPLLCHLHEGIAKKGILTLKFNFPYRERGKKAPDRTPILESTWRAVVAALRNDEEYSPNHLILSGKSLGGRIASHLAAQGEACAGLIFFGYPLHPPSNPEKLRTDHLTNRMGPMLFIQGTRDTLCRLPRLYPVLEMLKPNADIHIIEGGNHSFKVPKDFGQSQEAVWDEIVNVSESWLKKSCRGK